MKTIKLSTSPAQTPFGQSSQDFRGKVGLSDSPQINALSHTLRGFVTSNSTEFDALPGMVENRATRYPSRAGRLMTSGPDSTQRCERKTIRFWRCGLVALIGLTGGLSGCGQSTYAERVNRSRDLLAYHARLDQSLQAEWARADWGLALRPPVRFRLMPAPPPPKANEEGLVEVVPDTRQPAYLGVELPGLVAAWEVPGEAFIYLCSNHQRFVDSQGSTATVAEPETFLADLEAVLQQGFEFTLSAEPARGPAERHAKFAERIPLSDQFAAPKAFDSIRIEKESDPKFAAHVYEHLAGRIQVALIVVYAPANPGNFENGARTALETIRVEPVVPRAAVQPGGATPGGIAPRPSAF
ncbi:hypothetical protein Pan44_30810 [Caulifigura coniformis]|uniref:Uncharacterized protein n=1 Tax=Caulifigura coniformis TaxID=2527983 RepID=A0A517SG11_9PLAN|nr:hypothetical protein [Caulifigura coniformis]QDT55040.1 hypothetical protein Pan44_30810 [Caulifigura coniformis]